MEREGRVITKAIVNYFAPLTFIGLLANFIPQLIIFVPVDEIEMCWFYFITKSPWQLENVPNGYYISAKIMNYVATAVEILVMLYYTKKIGSNQFDLK